MPNANVSLIDSTSLFSMPLLTTKAVGQYIGAAEETVRSWRRTGFGPPFIRLSPRAVRYKREDVEAWLATNKRISTSQTAEQAANTLRGAG